MRNDDKVIAIFCSDLHLSAKPPLIRAEEKDWFGAMKYQLDQLSDMTEKHKAPIYCAGDVFDRWNSSPELINFALENLPIMFAIPGQHDMPLHSWELLERSAFRTLVKAKKIFEMPPREPHALDNNFFVYGYPWGIPIERPKLAEPWKFNTIALIHEYTWIPGHSYPGASDENMASKSKYEGWHSVVCGDNHKGFLTKCGDTQVLNCGGFMRRKSDEIDYKPQVGLLLSTGEIKIHYLDTSKDVISETVKADSVKDECDLSEFIQGLSKLDHADMDFKEAVKQVLDKGKFKQSVVELIMGAME